MATSSRHRLRAAAILGVPLFGRGVLPAQYCPCVHTPRSSANGMNHTCLCLPSRSWYSFNRPRRDGRLSWPWVAGWLHTEISVRHRELNLDMVAHLSTNRVRRRLTSLIEANALTTTPDRQWMICHAALKDWRLVYRTRSKQQTLTKEESKAPI